MNMVRGIHSLQYVAESIPSDVIYVFVNNELKDINLDTTLRHLVKKTFHVVYISRDTRGAIETAYLGLKQSGIPLSEQVCFYDNDTVYSFTGRTLPSHSFIGYSKTTETRPYCYIKVKDGYVEEISEKVRISDDYACGIYSFTTGQLFMDVAKEVMEQGVTFNSEFYMSIAFGRLLDKKEQVSALMVEDCLCLGTPEDIARSIPSLPVKPLRICFDLDNTIFKYRTAEQSYAECDVIEKNVFLLKKLKADGHTIILHTARGMKTHESNVGRSMKANGMDTFASLEKHSIPYDELYFGKPHADLYIDDRAFNPYIDLYSSIGFGYLTDEFYKSKSSSSSSNQFNLVYRIGDTIIKQGPSGTMKGELFFYKAVENTPLKPLFPALLRGDSGMLHLQYIRGFTMFDLMRDGLFVPKHLQLVLEAIDTMHSYTGIDVVVSKDQIYSNYMGKLKSRATNKANYPFDNVQMLVDRMDRRMKTYLETSKTCAVVHGDAWFSNTLITKTNNVVFLDMKGDIDGMLTTNGDALTDYGKMFQSLLGFDYYINGLEPNTEQLLLLSTFFIEEIAKRGFSYTDLCTVTACLIAKTLSFMKVDISVRTKIWGLVESILSEE
jgi:capsule biosynthesis phosphatase